MDFLEFHHEYIGLKTGERKMIGLQVRKRRHQVSKDVIDAFRSIPVANISDCMARIVAGGAQLRPYHSGKVLAGPAVTVKVRPGDNLLIHKALHMAEPGDVIVVDGGGELTNALIGELMVATAAQRKLAGFVINGAIRDSATIAQGDFPVFAAGVTHRGPYKDGPGEINVPIAIQGMVIHPGDLVIGDADGVLGIPREHAQDILRAAQMKADSEEVTLKEISGGTLDTSWIDDALANLGYRVEK